MSKHASPVVVGAFVVTAIALLLAGLMILGAGRYFRDTAEIAIYFDGSVAGLRVGAPVKFRGIEIGEVTDIRIDVSRAVRDPKNVRVRVLVAVDKDLLSEHGVKSYDLDNRKHVAVLVDRGLRAQLATESLVTGLRYVALDIKPKAPAVLMNDHRYPEIPSVRTSQQAIADKLERVLDKIADTDIAELIDSMHETVRSIKATVENADSLLRSPGLIRAVARIDDVVIGVDKAVADVANTTRDLAPAVAELKQAATSARKTVTSAEPLAHQLDVTLRDIQVAARSVRRLSDQLSRDPGALLRGGKQ